MDEVLEVYNLKNDSHLIELIQKASLNPDPHYGLKIEGGLLFGTKEWFNAIEKGAIKSHFLKGVISKVYMAGHNDFPEFEIENKEGKTNWERKGIDEYYKTGRNIELVLVEQKLKRGPLIEHVVEIKIATQS